MSAPSTTWFFFRAQYPIFSWPQNLVRRPSIIRERSPPIIVEPLETPSAISKSAVVIFLHGLSDDAEAIEPVIRHMQGTAKHPNVTWILPNAIEGHCLTAEWFFPRRLTSTPPSRQEQEDEEEDEEGLMASVQYVESLIDEQVAEGVPVNRIILGGFSQGHAVALLTSLVSSKYAGRLAGVVGLSGYLPLATKIPKLRVKAGLPAKTNDDMAIFLTRGSKDNVIPERYASICTATLLDMGVKPENLTIRKYQGLGHAIRNDELEHFGGWLEKAVPRWE
ncbi:acyl-protein thioesterase 1 [Periconia macrospinosa]|uniref:Acyl-protein thioesterase 1 n=1 Tax=Periconia macrospinosa TaxID=97972 RepID=A0A2V1E9U3_9PLEO|nr:acyl-protein thioesterase 1 [Periconia macrospinosa]